MKKHITSNNGRAVAIIQSSEPVITDTQSALDLIATVSHVDNCQMLAINKEAVCDDFFVLSTGIAGEVLQKFINYSMKMAIIGDFSEYTSSSLKDFIYECNQGNHIYFVSDEQMAMDKLTVAV